MLLESVACNPKGDYRDDASVPRWCIWSIAQCVAYDIFLLAPQEHVAKENNEMKINFNKFTC